MRDPLLHRQHFNHRNDQPPVCSYVQHAHYQKLHRHARGKPPAFLIQLHTIITVLALHGVVVLASYD